MKQEITINQEGVIATLSLLLTSVLALALTITVAVLAADGLKMAGSELAAEQTYYAAEAGINEGLYQLSSHPLPAVYNITVSGATVQITVSTDPNDLYGRIIKSKAIDVTGKVRTLQIAAKTGTPAVGLEFAVQTGIGGLEMESNTEVHGDIYCNGSIDGSTGNNPQGKIYGNVTSAGALVKLVEVIGTADSMGDLYARAIEQSEVDGNVYSQLDLDQSTLDYLTHHGGIHDRTRPDPTPRDLPITDAHINQWKTEIENQVNQAIANGSGQLFGDKTIEASTSWGVTKIEGNLIIKKNNTQLTVTDSLWVTGNLTVENNAQLTLYKNILVNGNINFMQGSSTNLNTSLGENDGVIIAYKTEANKGKITVENGANVDGSGHSNSSLMLLTNNNSLDTGSPAISVANVSDGVFYYAKDGKIVVGNGGNLNGILAHTVHLKQNAVVTYDEDLMFIITNPGINILAVETVPNSWQEV